MLKLINGATSLRREFLEPDPDEESTAKVMPLRTRFAALAAFQAGDVLACAVQLLDLPAEAAPFCVASVASCVRSFVTTQSVRWGDTATRNRGPVWSLGTPLILMRLPWATSWALQASVSTRRYGG